MVFDQVDVESRIFNDVELAKKFTDEGVADLYDSEGVIDYVSVADHALDVLGYVSVDVAIDNVFDTYFIDLSGKWTLDAVLHLIDRCEIEVDRDDREWVESVAWDMFGLENVGSNNFERL